MKDDPTTRSITGLTRYGERGLDGAVESWENASINPDKPLNKVGCAKSSKER